MIKMEELHRNMWGKHPLHLLHLANNLRQIVKIGRSDNNMTTVHEKDNFHSERVIGTLSSHLVKSPENKLFVLSECIFKNTTFSDISVLQSRPYLQYLHITHQNLVNVDLTAIPYLLFLNLSYNKLIQIPNCSSAWYITHINLAHNCISAMDGLSSLWSIVKLDLSYNEITVINDLQNLKYLLSLNLSYNFIERLENLDNLNIEELNLEGNYIISSKSTNPEQGIHTLSNLRVLLLGKNKLSTLHFLKDAYSLRVVDLKFNQIDDLLELSNLKNVIYEVDLKGNPCTEWPNYRAVLLSIMSNLIRIDGAAVLVTERRSAATIFAPSLDISAMRAVAKLRLLDQLRMPNIEKRPIAFDAHYPPLIILTGPSAVKKVTIALCVATMMSDKIRYCPWYTTRDSVSTDDSRAHIVIRREEFNEMMRNGDFLVVEETLGHSYGLHTNEINCLILERKVGITYMNLHSTLQVRDRYSNVHTVLVTTENVGVHRTWICRKFDIFMRIIDSFENIQSVNVREREYRSLSVISTIGDSTEFLEIPNVIDEKQIIPIRDERRHWKEKYTEFVLISRRQYLEQHLSKPGFFSLVIQTDDYSTAIDALTNFIQSVRFPTKRPSLTHQVNALMQDAIFNTTEAIYNDLKK